MASVLGCIRVGLLFDQATWWPLKVSLTIVPSNRLGDANQAMRVSSALEAGTVSDLVAALQGIRYPGSDPPNLRPTLLGLGKPI